MRRGYRGLFLVAAFIALLVTYPHEVLIVMALPTCASGFADHRVEGPRDSETAADAVLPGTPRPGGGLTLQHQSQHTRKTPVNKQL